MVVGAGPVWIRRSLGLFVELGGLFGIWGDFATFRIIFGF